MAHPAGSCFRAARECHGSRGAGTGPIPPDRFHRADSTGPIPPGRFRRSRYGRYGLLPVRPFPYTPRAMKIEAPFEQHRDIVRPEWIDYNGHTNVPYYNIGNTSCREKGGWHCEISGVSVLLKKKKI